MLRRSVLLGEQHADPHHGARAGADRLRASCAKVTPAARRHRDMRRERRVASVRTLALIRVACLVPRAASKHSLESSGARRRKGPVHKSGSASGTDRRVTHESGSSRAGRVASISASYGKIIAYSDGHVAYRRACKNQKQRAAARRFYERRDLLVSQNGEARIPGPAASQRSTDRARAAARAPKPVPVIGSVAPADANTTHGNLRVRLGERGPECPCARSTSARLMTAGGTGRGCRYTYCCGTCGRWFQQRPPHA